MIKAIQTVSGSAVPLLRSNIDTDVIIRIERLTEFGRDELSPYAFEALRYRSGHGASDLDPDCVFNQARYLNAPILIAGANFGCGSSREGAVWALQCLGIQCVIAPSFGGIFANNCFQNGVLTIELPPETVARLAAIAEADATAPFRIDLAAKTVTPPNEAAIPFAIETLKQSALLQGLDQVGLTETRRGEIDAFQARDRAARPWVYDHPTSS